MAKILAVTEYYNEAENIPGLVANVASQSLPPTHWLVIDDGSTDDSKSLFEKSLEKHPISYIVHRMPPKSRPDASKKGVAFRSIELLNTELVKSSGFDYLLKIDADTRLPTKYIEFGAKVMDSLRDIGAMAGKIHGELGSETPMGTAKFVRWDVVKATAGRYWDLDPDSLWNMVALKLGYKLVVLDDVRVDVTRPTHMVAAKGLYDYGRRMYYLGWNIILASLYAVVLLFRRNYPVHFFRGYLREFSKGNWYCRDLEIGRFYGLRRMILRRIGAVPMRDKGTVVKLGIEDALERNMDTEFLAEVTAAIRRQMRSL